MASQPAPKPRPVEIINDIEATAEVLASAITNVSDGIKKLRAGKLSDRALLILIRDACPEVIGLDKIRMVLDAMGNLSKRYVK